jgi:hypothetical protein
MTTKAARDAAVMPPDKRQEIDVKSKHPGGSDFKAGNLALADFDDPWDPTRNKPGYILDWTPSEMKSRGGRNFNRRTLHTCATSKTKIKMDWIPLMFGPTEDADPDEDPKGPKTPLREMVYKMQAESPLEMIPMDVKTYVRWDGVKEFNIDGKRPAFMPAALEILTCGSKREYDDFTLMGTESLKLAELLLMGTTVFHTEQQIKNREEPLLGFQVPRSLPMTGDTCTGRVLSETMTFENTAVEARTATKLVSMWEVQQTLVVKEHQLEDPDIGMYMIPVLHIETIVAKTHIGSRTPVRFGYAPDVAEVNAMWHEMHSQAVIKGMQDTWSMDEPWKQLFWGERDTRISEERRSRIIEQSQSVDWKKHVFGNPRFMMTPRTTKMGPGTCYGTPVMVMLFEERNNRRKHFEDSKPSAKRNVDDAQSGPNKKRRSGHEILLEEGSIAEAKGVARGSSVGKSSA